MSKQANKYITPEAFESVRGGRYNMGQLKDLTGQKFGKLTVLRRAEDRKRGRPMWLCQCECGNQTVVSSTRLLLPNGM